MNIKSLLLGSAAAFVAVSGARAADAVVIAEPEPMEYVRICDTYGVGFYYIPGTETCLKVSGYIRYDIGVGGFGLTDVIDKDEFFDDFFEDERGDYGTNDTYDKRARFQLRVDSRTETELGTLRTYAAVNFQWDSGSTGGYDDPEFFDPENNGFTFSEANFGVEHAYLELGGFRAGKTDSLFSTFTGYAGGVIHDDIIGYGPFDTHQLAYTFTGGNGFSAAVALEMGAGNQITPFDQNDFYGSPAGDLYTLDSYVPHVVGGVGWTGGWGGVSVVAGYDSVWEEGAVKGRVDFNAGDAWSFFVMAAWASVDDDFFDDDDEAGPFIGFDLDDGPNFYAPWGGEWALWAGTTWTFSEQAKFNFQVSYDEWEDLAVVANVQYELVPGFTITPEIAYIDNLNSDFEDFYGESVVDENWAASLRLQANFGG